MILFDMDGVIANFVKGLCKVHGIPYIHDDPKHDGKWDGVGIVAEILGISKEQVWAKTHGPQFWIDLEPMPDGLALLRSMPDAIICTSPTIGYGCYDGKMTWIEKHCPEFKRRVCVCTVKWELAHPWAILFDDSDENCRKFREHGGQAVLASRPFNSAHAEPFELAAARLRDLRGK